LSDGTQNVKMFTFPESDWRSLGVKMITKGGIPEEEAETITDVLVTGSLAGIDSHGVRNIPFFSRKAGKRRMKIAKKRVATILLDPGDASGPVVGKYAMELAIRNARKTGVSCVSIKGGDWLTNLFYYALMAAREDMISLVFVRASPPVTAPWGGAKAITGTDPIAFSFPAGKSYPIVMDFATSIVAGQHTKTMSLMGQPFPAGWFIDKNGKMAPEILVSPQDWEKFISENVLNVFGAYKGYGIAVATELMGGALSMVGTVNRSHKQGFTAVVIDVSAFSPIKEFKKEVDRFVKDVKSSPVREGFEEVLLPGEKEFRMMQKRKKEGIPIDDYSWRAITKKCEELGIDAAQIMQPLAVSSSVAN